MQSTAGAAGCNAAGKDIPAGYKPGRMQKRKGEIKRWKIKKN